MNVCIKEQPKILAIIFDLDDTLMPEWQYQISGFKVVSTYLSKKYSIKQNIFFDFLKNDYFNGNRTKNYNRLVKKFQLKEDIQLLVKLHRNHIPEISLYPDARHFLDNYSGKYKIGIITDGDKDAQRNKIQSLQLKNIVQAILITEALGNNSEFCKPSEKAFLKMLKILDVKPHEAIYVGDNPKKDFIGPHKIDMTTIHISRRDGEYYNVKVPKPLQADYKIDNLMMIEEKIAQIESKE